jgi:hypothetical protein
VTTIHERARALMNRSVCEQISEHESEWLSRHVFLCAACTSHKEALEESINGFRREVGSIIAAAPMVRRTQSAVRLRAAQLRRQEERMSPLWIACVIAGLWAILSLPLIWEGTHLFAGRTPLPTFVLQIAGVFLWLMPTGAAVALGVWSRGMRAVEG